MIPINQIRIAGLKDGNHRQVFNIKDKFFEAYKESDVLSGRFLIETLLTIKGLDKRLTIDIKGEIENLICDYCAKNIICPISITLHFILKESDSQIESVDEIIYITPNQHQLNLDQLIFEMINLSIPSKISHNEDEQREGKCDTEMLMLMNKYSTKNNKKIDPRWEVLKKIM